MKTGKVLSVFLFSIIALFAVHNAGCKGGITTGGEGVEVENIAPGFELPSLDGETVSLEDYRGGAVLLSFGTTWCPYCLKEIPELKAIYEKFSGIKIIYIDVRESKAAVEELVTMHGIPYTVLLDENGKTNAVYKITGFPTVFVIDKEGIIRYKGHSIPEGIEKF